MSRLDVFGVHWANVGARQALCLLVHRGATERVRPSVSVMPESIKLPATGALMLPTGIVSLEQLAAVLSTLPLDLTFVDANDRVAFFTEGPNRIFARSKAIIGRKVQHCHPPRSVKTLTRFWMIFAPADAQSDFSCTFMSAVRFMAFADRSCSFQQDVQEISRFSCMLFLSVRGFLDYAGPTIHSRLAWLPCCLPPYRNGVGILFHRLFEAQ